MNKELFIFTPQSLNDMRVSNILAANSSEEKAFVMTVITEKSDDLSWISSWLGLYPELKAAYCCSSPGKCMVILPDGKTRSFNSQERGDSPYSIPYKGMIELAQIAFFGNSVPYFDYRTYIVGLERERVWAETIGVRYLTIEELVEKGEQWQNEFK